MRIERRNPFTGKIRSMDIPVTEEQMARWQAGGIMIQDAMPNLKPSEREFILTGILQEEWDKMFKEDE